MEVHFPAPSDVDPAYWSPSAEVVIEYQQAELVLLNSADYAKWLQRVSLPRSALVEIAGTTSPR